MSSYDYLLRVSAIQRSSFELKKDSNQSQQEKKHSGNFKEILEEKMKEDNVIEHKSTHMNENIHEIRNTALLESLNETEQYLRLRLKK